MPSDTMIPGILSTPGLTTGIGASLQKTDDPKKTREAAAQFEALLVGQILKSAHEEGGGWLGAGDDDQTASSAMQMADEYFARAMTAHGGLGLAKMITAGVTKEAEQASSRSNPASSKTPEEIPHKP
jgi:Rod binding domain-containing protein